MKVGDTLYYRYNDRYQMRSGYAEVVKVGKKWATLSNKSRIDLTTLRSDVGASEVPVKYWRSKDEHDKGISVARLFAKFRILVQAVHFYNDLTIEQIVASAAALGIDLDPKGKQ